MSEYSLSEKIISQLDEIGFNWWYFDGTQFSWEKQSNISYKFDSYITDSIPSSLKEKALMLLFLHNKISINNTVSCLFSDPTSALMCYALSSMTDYKSSFCIKDGHLLVSISPYSNLYNFRTNSNPWISPRKFKFIVDCIFLLLLVLLLLIHLFLRR